MKDLKDYINESIGARKKIFVVIKPGFLDKTSYILDVYKENGWVLEYTTIKQLMPEEARKLYSIHKKKDFYKPLCEYMSSSITRALIFTKETNDDEFKEASRIKDEIREKWGESDMRNVVHSSDSKENFEKEASIYFGYI
jgi:nucleoside-diphosphate kinase